MADEKYHNSIKLVAERGNELHFEHLNLEFLLDAPDPI